MRLTIFFDKSESFFWQGADPPILTRDLGNILPCTPSLSGQAFRPSLSPPNPDFVSVGLPLTALESFHPCTVPYYHQLHQPSTSGFAPDGRSSGRSDALRCSLSTPDSHSSRCLCHHIHQKGLSMISWPIEWFLLNSSFRCGTIPALANIALFILLLFAGLGNTCQ